MKEENFDNQSATKGDVVGLRSELKADIGDVKNELKVEINTSTEKLNQKIDALGQDLRNFKSEVAASFKELGEAIQLFATNVDSRFNEVHFDLKDLKVRTVRIESTMVTKDYLDEKMADFRGDLTVLVRKEDNKVKALVEVLVEKKVLSQNDQKRIYSMEPFAQ